MAQERILEVEIDLSTGVPTIDTLNFVGKECESIQDQLQASLAGDVIEKVEKPEKEAEVQTVAVARQGVRR